LDLAAHDRRDARAGARVAPDPADLHVVGVHLLAAPEDLLVQPEDEVDLEPGTSPVLGGEPVGGEPPDAEAVGRAHDLGQAFLALAVTLGARQTLAFGPTAVAVHDDGDVPRKATTAGHP